MKVFVISDVTLEPIKKKQLSNSKFDYSFIFSENLVLGIDSFENNTVHDNIYIHFDTYFKKYSEEYVLFVFSSILRLSQRIKNNIVLSNILDLGWHDTSLFSSVGAFNTYDSSLYDIIQQLKKRSNVIFLDVQTLILEVGRNNTYNFSLGHLYQLPYTKLFLDKFALLLDNFILKINSVDKKVIILDCDNTIWKGIVGEDGVEGIACDLNSNGILYYHFQQFLLTRKLMGFILCLCSKNNEEDVKHVFDKKRLPLRWDDFIIKKINWNNKDSNIKEISQELNLGTDSFIFIDDNDFELNNIARAIPEVTLFKFTDNYQDFLNLTTNLVFTKKSITTEDFYKTEYYLTDSKRKNLQESSTDYESYIKSLEIQIKIEEDLESDLARVSQLTEKTNQFNFNKKFYSIEILKNKIELGEFKIFTLKVNDKFGDYGLVGVILIQSNGNEVVLENFILSCRVLGRRIEFDFLKYVKNRVLEVYKLELNQFKFSPTLKNIPAQDFYNQLIKNV